MKSSARSGEVFSFKNIETDQSEPLSESSQPANVPQTQEPKRASKEPTSQQYPTSMAHYRYRIDQIAHSTAIRERIPVNLLDLDKELENNARRRVELQRKMLAEQIIQRETNYIKKAVQASSQPNLEMQAEQFKQLQLERARNRDLLLPSEEKKTSVKLSVHPKPKPAPLDPAELLAISRELTFPEAPSNKVLQACQKRLSKLLQDHKHSDVLFLLMVACFHKEQYNRTIELFEELLRFKVVNPVAFWVAAETFFAQESHEKCMKIAELALSKLNDSVFPRLLYLRARSACLALHLSEATALYNQLIKLCPRVPQYRLQRAMLFEQTGMYDFARQDFAEFARLSPQWNQELKEQIILEKEPHRKQYLSDCLLKLRSYT